MSEYSGLFTSGLQRAIGSEASISFPQRAHTRLNPSLSARFCPRPGDKSPFLQPPAQGTSLITSPARRTRFAQPSPRRKHRSSFTTNVLSPLAGIKTPVKAAEIAGRMQSMLLSPSRAVGRAKQPISTPNDESLSGAPMKQRPFTR